VFSLKDKYTLNDILYSIELIYQYLNGISEQDFYNSQEKQDLVVHRLELIGEAAKRLSDEVIRNSRYIPWKEIKGMRDILIHQYDNILLEVVWTTVQKRIPVIEQQIKEMVSTS